MVSCSRKLRSCCCLHNSELFCPLAAAFQTYHILPLESPLDFLLPPVSRTDRACNTEGMKICSGGPFTQLCSKDGSLSVFLLPSDGDLAPSCAPILCASLETRAASYSDSHPLSRRPSSFCTIPVKTPPLVQPCCCWTQPRCFALSLFSLSRPAAQRFTSLYQCLSISPTPSEVWYRHKSFTYQM